MKRPNVLFITADDHATAALSCYGPTPLETPNLDRIASEGARLERCFCTNALCTPARATMLTGLYSHVSGIRTLDDTIDQTRQRTVARDFREAGYQTALFGKWHLGHGGASDPADFDDWAALPVQGSYFDPELLTPGGRERRQGYVTDVLTDLSLDWLERRDPERPFLLWLGHKAPHDPFGYHPRHARLLADTEVPEPATLRDDHAGRPAAARSAQRVDRMLEKKHLPESPPEGLAGEELRAWCYQTFLKSYLRCVAAVDENVGRLLDHLDAQDLAEDTVVVYTSDHGFFLGEHGFYDKRYMYEPSIRIPFLLRYPREIPAGASSDAIALNVDFAPTLLALAGLEAPSAMQGRSLEPLLRGETPSDWRTSMYYRYWMHGAHFGVPAHYGVRTGRHKLIYYYGDPLDAAGAEGEPTAPTWELYDLERDPTETHNLYHDPDHTGVRERLRDELRRLQAELGDEPFEPRPPT